MIATGMFRSARSPTKRPQVIYAVNMRVCFFFFQACKSQQFSKQTNGDPERSSQASFKERLGAFQGEEVSLGADCWV